MDDCIFCKIIKGDIPCTKVWEDSETFAFLSTNPNNHGHTLVVPKKHFRNIFDKLKMFFLKARSLFFKNNITIFSPF